MSDALSRSLPPREQLALYELLGKQVKSYHRHYHMGENTSVPTEVAQALLRSIWYTLDLGPGDTLADRLRSGQALLEERLEAAKMLQKLVADTTPEYESQCRWEAVSALGRYLQGYDHLHFAHRGPEELFYPLLARMPEDAQGLDEARFYLNCLWLENLLLQAFPEGAVEALYAQLPPDYWEAPQNLCEQPLINGLGRVLLRKPLDSLTLTDGDLAALTGLLTADAKKRLSEAMEALCAGLKLTPAAAEYARGLLPELLPRLNAALPGGDLSYIFL